MSSTETLRQIALDCRDAVKSGSITKREIAKQYGLSRWQVTQIVGAIELGDLDREHVSERPIGRLEENAKSERVQLPESGNVLVIGDTHIPFVHPDYLDFCVSVRDEYECEVIVHIGDEVDNHAISYHESDPDGFSAGHEMDMAIKELGFWYRAFPEVTVIVGNHGALPFRKAYTAGLPRKFIRSYEEIWEAPAGWKWTLSATGNGVMYEHGLGSSGKNAALNRALDNRCSSVIGHVHSYGGVQWSQNNDGAIFGMNVGCGVDISAYAMAYGKHYPRKPTLGCGVVLRGGEEAHFIPMLPR